MIKYKPDFNRLKKVLLREGEPDMLPFFELFADPEIIEAVMGKKLNMETVIEFQQKMGYDYIGAGINFIYPKTLLSTKDTASLSRGKRNFVDDNHGLIESRKDYNTYKWPKINKSVVSSINKAVEMVPEGMKVIISLPGGVLENVMWLMGYIPLSYALYDDTSLVSDMFERIGSEFVKILKISLSESNIEKIGAVVMGDDMGYSTSTMIDPEHLRKYVFPWQKELVKISHRYNLPFILHSCGNLEEVMEDLIEDVGIDAKHSFEDKIMPVDEAKEKYGNRIAILGGVDMDFIASKSENQVKDYVEKIIQKCAPKGGYALGTGNTVANYIPLKNYYAMLKTGREKGIYPIN